MEKNGLRYSFYYDDYVDDYITISCDICRVEICDYDLVCNCDALSVLDRHNICLTCCYNAIKQSSDFKDLLKDTLKDLSSDCIQEITNYILGPVCLTCTMKQTKSKKMNFYETVKQNIADRCILQ